MQKEGRKGKEFTTFTEVPQQENLCSARVGPAPNCLLLILAAVSSQNNQLGLI